MSSNPAPQFGTFEGIRVREDLAYTNPRNEANDGVRRRTQQSLEKLQGILRKLLREAEAVVYVARCQAPVGALDQLTFGWYIHRITASVLVFTDRGILHFLTKGDGTLKGGPRQVLWGDIAEASVKGWLNRQVRLVYKNGTKENYWKLKRGDARKLEALLPQFVGVTGAMSAAGGVVQLCPACTATIPEKQYQCNQCGAVFKDERTMIRHSILLPGGGYFYTGHPFLGIGDFIVETVLLSAVLTWTLAASGLIILELDPLESASTPAEALFIAGILAVFLVFEKLVTVYHCRRFIREYIPSTEQGAAGLVAVRVVALIATAFLVWASMDVSQPAATLAPDLVVAKANFGVFAADSFGNPTFEPAVVVPRGSDREFGWVLRLRTSRPLVRWREEIDLVSGPGVNPQEKIGQENGEDAAAGGLLISRWNAAADPGRYRLRVYLEDVLVLTQEFLLQ